MKTYQPKHKDVKRDWHLIDAKEKILGRLSTQVTGLLMGKHKPKFSKHMDMGDYVVLVNAKDITLTGKKRKQKVYYRHSGFPGGFREIKFEKMISEKPTEVIKLAVKRMLPNNRLRRDRMTRLRVFADEKHPYKNKFAE